MSDDSASFIENQSLVCRALPAPMHQHNKNTSDAKIHFLPPKAVQSLNPLQMSSSNTDRIEESSVKSESPPQKSCSNTRLAPSDATRLCLQTAGLQSVRNYENIFARRQSAPGPCIPRPSSKPAASKKQWTLTPCGFTNERGQYLPDTSPQSQEKPGEYDETSIRYTGKANPSKFFRLLQTATGSDTELDIKNAKLTRRRLSKDTQLTEDCNPSNPDDIIDITYVGPKIPSKTFRCLQEAIDTRTPQEFNESPCVNHRSVRVIHLRPSAMKKHSSMDNILTDL